MMQHAQQGSPRVYPAPTDLVEAAELLRIGSVLRIAPPSGGEAWMILGYDEVRAALADPRVGRAPLVTSDSIPYKAKFPKYLTDTLQFKDGAEHMRLRRVLARWFAPRQINKFRVVVEAECDRLLDVIAGSGAPTDLVGGYAVPVPIYALTTLLGAEREMASEFLRWNQILFGTDEASTAAMPAIEAECASYLREQIGHKRRAPGDDVLSALVQAESDGLVTETEVVSLAMLLLIAGFDNTANFIGTGAYTLLKHVDQLAFLQADVEGRIDGVVEELLRHGRQSVGRGVNNLGMPFAALEDVEIAGVHIAAGEPILINRNAANHDPSVYDSPLDLRVDRVDNPHLSLSYGIHACLGAPLARLEMRASLSKLFLRFPNLQLAGEPRYQKNTMSEAIEYLPVTW